MGRIQDFSGGRGLRPNVKVGGGTNLLFGQIFPKTAWNLGRRVVKSILPITGGEAEGYENLYFFTPFRSRIFTPKQWSLPYYEIKNMLYLATFVKYVWHENKLPLLQWSLVSSKSYFTLDKIEFYLSNDLCPTNRLHLNNKSPVICVIEYDWPIYVYCKIKHLIRRLDYW